MAALSSAELLEPPSYSLHATAPPLYTPEPHEDESRLICIPPRSAAAGTFIKKCGGITLVLTGQENGAAVNVPTYTPSGVVRGELLLEDQSTVQSVVIKLEGRQLVQAVGSGIDLAQVCNETRTLWSRSGADASTTPCPTIIPLDVPFPRSWTSGSGTNPLPPTFEAKFPGSGEGLFVECKYSITATVNHARMGGWKWQSLVTTPILFRRRAMPYMPITPVLQFLSLSDPVLVGWRQDTSVMSPKDQSLQQSLKCLLYTPSVQVFGLKDTIPFKIHLLGPSAGLLSLFATPTASSKRISRGFKALSSALRLASPPRSSSEGPSQSAPNSPTIAPASPDLTRVPSMNLGNSPSILQVYLLRQVCVHLNGRKSWRDVVLGEGKLWPLYGEALNLRQEGSDEKYSLDWGGEVRCGDDVTVPSFTSGSLVVKDFIVVELKPTTESPYKNHQYVHPIRLVTDSYSGG